MRNLTTFEELLKDILFENTYINTPETFGPHSDAAEYPLELIDGEYDRVYGKALEYFEDRGMLERNPNYEWFYRWIEE